MNDSVLIAPASHQGSVRYASKLPVMSRSYMEESTIMMLHAL